MSFNFTAIADDIAATQTNANETVEGGSIDRIPPKGLARLRFTGYIEAGKAKKSFKGEEKVEDRVLLIFELSGKNYEPHVTEDGEKIPYRITVRLNKSNHEKALYPKVFRAMNYDGKATSFVQLLGQPFLANVGHFTYKDKEGKDKTTANFRDEAGNLTIRAPRVETLDEDGEIKVVPVKVDAAISPQRCLVWNSKQEWLGQMWESLRIPGAEDGGYFHKMVKEAINFEGSAIEEYLATKGEDLGIPPATDAKAPKESPATGGKGAKGASAETQKDEDAILDELGL
mgnify:CR=1 FL=1